MSVIQCLIFKRRQASTGRLAALKARILSNGTAYTFTVTATNNAGTGPASAATTSVTPSANPTFTPALVSGFNLLGNLLNTTLNVMSIFGNQTSPVSGVTDNVASVWKWDVANSNPLAAALHGSQRLLRGQPQLRRADQHRSR